MAPIATLTNGCLLNIMNGVDVDKPVLQILGAKRIASAEGNERFRLLVSDGKWLHSFAILATQLNDMYHSGQLTDNSIVRVDKYTTSVINRTEKSEKRVLIFLGLELLTAGSEVKERIGNPVPLSEGESDKSAATSSSTDAANNNSTKPVGGISNGSMYKKPTPVMNNSSNLLNASLNDSLTHPINSLSPYQNKWVIKARVTHKSNIRTWSNAKGEGKLFSMDLVDESGEIRATAFKDQCDKFYDMIEVDKVYYISKCQLKPANKQFSTLKNDYEMTFTNETVVQECFDARDSLPTVQYDFVPISQIANMEPNSLIDVAGVCTNASELQQFTARSSGRELKKREITLVDTSLASVSLTLWGSDAENFDATYQPVVLIKGARVNEFGGGKNLGLIGNSTMKINPDIPEGHKLRGWFDNGGAANISNSVSARNAAGGSIKTDWMTFYDTKIKNLGHGDKPDYFQVRAVIHIVKSANSVYKACPQTDCNKKVIDQENGQYRCEKCNVDYPNFKYRLLLNMSIGDWTSNRWVTCFTDLAEQLLGKTSQEIGEALEQNREDADTVFGDVNFKSFVFKLRTKVEHFGDTPRNKITAIGASPVNYKEYNEYLIKNLQELTGIGKNE